MNAPAFRRASDHLCLALDFSSGAEVLKAARRFGPRVGWLKIGLEAFVSEGPSLVADVARHAPVFLDLKFHDIPKTVARAVAAAARSGASMVNVHASGGREMLLAARGAVAQKGHPLLIAVTLLTSIDTRSLADLPMAGHPEGIARRLALLARDCGLDGVVCSPLDLLAIRAACGSELLTVVPGIRASGAAADDQKRHASASEALAAGADLLVVGRPVTEAEDPERALEQLIAEIESARRRSVDPASGS